MAYRRKAAEGAVVLALVLAPTGCVSSREHDRETFGRSGWDLREAMQTVPDALDYLGNVQCGALASLRGDLTTGRTSRDFYQQMGMFRSWAEVRAREAGRNPDAASGAIDAMAADLLAGLGDGKPPQKLARLSAAYEGDLNVCDSSTKNFAFHIILGG